MKEAEQEIRSIALDCLHALDAVLLPPTLNTQHQQDQVAELIAAGVPSVHARSLYPVDLERYLPMLRRLEAKELIYRLDVHKEMDALAKKLFALHLSMRSELLDEAADLADSHFIRSLDAPRMLHLLAFVQMLSTMPLNELQEPDPIFDAGETLNASNILPFLRSVKSFADNFCAAFDQWLASESEQV